MDCKSIGWNYLIEKCISDDPYSVNNGLSEISILADSTLFDDSLSNNKNDVVLGLRKYQKENTILPTSDTLEDISENKLKSHLYDKCSKPSYIYDYNADEQVIIIEHVDAHMTTIHRLDNITAILSKDIYDNASMRYISIVAKNIFGYNTIVINTAWSVYTMQRLVDFDVCLNWEDNEYKYKRWNRYYLGYTCPFPRFATKPFTGALNSILWRSQRESDVFTELSRERVPFMKFHEIDSERIVIYRKMFNLDT